MIQYQCSQELNTQLSHICVNLALQETPYKNAFILCSYQPTATNQSSHGSLRNKLRRMVAQSNKDYCDHMLNGQRSQDRPLFNYGLLNGLLLEWWDLYPARPLSPTCTPIQQKVDWWKLCKIKTKNLLLFFYKSVILLSIFHKKRELKLKLNHSANTLLYRFCAHCIPTGNWNPSEYLDGEHSKIDTR